MRKEHIWKWPLASDLFLGGLGGGMLVISSVADLFFDKGNVFSLGTIVAAIIIGLGAGLLVFDLSRPLYFWRVFSGARAILTIGAWISGLAIICGLVYGSTLLSFSPWHNLAGLQSALAWICLFLGLGITIYTGIFLGTIKARPFWNSPALPVIFLVSSITTGLAAQSLLLHFQVFGITKNEMATVTSFLNHFNLGSLVLEIIVLMIYVLIMRYSATVSTAQIAAIWLSGSKKLQFWGGLIFWGLVLPIVFYLLPGSIMFFLAAAFVLIGGIILRFLIVYTDDRTLLPGEKKFYSWLPDENEAFLHSWKE
jgi:protein NrfD